MNDTTIKTEMGTFINWNNGFYTFKTEDDIIVF